MRIASPAKKRCERQFAGFWAVHTPHRMCSVTVIDALVRMCIGGGWGYELERQRPRHACDDLGRSSDRCRTFMRSGEASREPGVSSASPLRILEFANFQSPTRAGARGSGAAPPAAALGAALPWALFWACPELALGLFWVCPGSVLGLFWACSGSVLGLFWVAPMALFWPPDPPLGFARIYL